MAIRIDFGGKGRRMDGHAIFIKIGVVQLKVGFPGCLIYLTRAFAGRDKNHPVAIKGGRKFQRCAVDAVAIFDGNGTLGQKIATTKKEAKD